LGSLYQSNQQQRIGQAHDAKYDYAGAFDSLKESLLGTRVKLREIEDRRVIKLTAELTRQMRR